LASRPTNGSARSTAYTNRYSIYLLRTPLTATGMRLTAYSLPLTIYLSRLTAYASVVRLPIAPKRIRLLFAFIFYLVFLALRCFLIGFSVIISFGAVGKSDYFLALRPPLPFLALFLLCASFTSFPEVVWDLSIPLPFGASLLALFKAARYFLRSGVEWYFLLYAFFFLRASGFCLKYSDEFIGGWVSSAGVFFWILPFFIKSLTHICQFVKWHLIEKFPSGDFFILFLY
jgi:hypothetical protein